jgi:hypothetical protein
MRLLSIWTKLSPLVQCKLLCSHVFAMSNWLGDYYSSMHCKNVTSWPPFCMIPGFIPAVDLEYFHVVHYMHQAFDVSYNHMYSPDAGRCKGT